MLHQTQQDSDGLRMANLVGGFFPDKNEKMVHVLLDGFALVSSHDELRNFVRKIQNF